MTLDENKRLLPNLIIIGAMKCGTTSLHHYLNLHPEIHMSPVKELDFFITEKNWRKGLAWYQSQFIEPAKVIGESSPNYTKYPAFRDVPKRMSALIPDAKLIYLVRDPIKRIVSHYLHQYIDRAEYRSFNEALSELNNNHYILCSLYAIQLEQFLTYYPLSRVLVVSLEELRYNRFSTLRKIFCFLDVDPNFEHPNFEIDLHRSDEKKRLTDFGSKLFQIPMGGRVAKYLPFSIAEKVESPKIESSLRKEVANFLKPDIERLRKLTGSSFADWQL